VHYVGPYAGQEWWTKVLCGWLLTLTLGFPKDFLLFYLTDFEKPRKRLDDISYTSRVIAHFVSNFVAMDTTAGGPKI